MQDTCIQYKRNYKYIKYIKERTPELCLESVRNNGYSLKYLTDKEKTIDICMEAVMQNGCSLRFVPIIKRTADICLEAVKQNECALYFVPNQTEELCLIALNKGAHIFAHIEKELLTEQMCLIAVKKHGYLLKYIPQNNHTYEIYLQAIKKYGHALDYIPEENRTNELCLEAVKQNKQCINYINCVEQLKFVCKNLNNYADIIYYANKNVKEQISAMPIIEFHNTNRKSARSVQQ